MNISGSEEEYASSDEELGDLGNFIVSDEEQQANDDGAGQEAEEQNDRILQMTKALKPNETQAQKLLKAHISVLVSALGGPDHTSPLTPPPYKLGHDALACLKDIKRWIKSVDERNSKFDVALACAESGLVVNELIVILCQWDNQQNTKKPAKNARTMEKIMLSCLELLVLLTWPIELTPESSENQKLNFANVRKSQIVYKKHILAHNQGQTLKAVIRLVLPTVAKNRIDREPRDNAILRLVLFFVRNVLNIEPANLSISTKSTKHVTQVDNMPTNINYDDISMNAVLSCFKKNKVLMFLLTISGSLGTDFDRETFGQSCLECIYLIIKGIKASDLLAPNQNEKQQRRKQQQQEESQENPIKPVTTTSGLELQDLLGEESRRKKYQSQNLSTRHGRFGSLLSIQGNNTSYVISGQEALLDTNSTLAKLDKSKKWNNRSNFKYDSDEYVKPVPEFINGSSVVILKDFIEQFLVGGCFNTLIECVGWLLSGSHDLNYVDDYEKASYFLTVSWFLNYKRERNVLLSDKHIPTDDDDGLDYGSVGVGLSEVNFILIISYFREAFEAKKWSSLHVAMICFRELLLISYSIFSKPNSQNDNEENAEQEDVDKELAEGIIRKLFTFNDFLNILIQIPQTAAKHSPDYLSVCISVVHIMLKSFESFANENIKLYIQTKRKKSKSSKRNINNLDKSTEDSLRDIIDGSDDELENERVKEVSRERRLDFKATEVRFFQTSIVTTYIEYLSRYEDLTHEEIKRCLSYFHRLFVIRKDFTGLYRLDFMHMIHKLRNYLPRNSSTREHVDEFIYYFMKKFKGAFERFPNPIEILFPRFEDMEYKTYLGTGDLYVKAERGNKKSNPRLAKQVEFIRNNYSLDEKFKILVTVLYQQEKESLVSWLTHKLSEISNDRLLKLTSEEARSNSQKDTELYPSEQHRRLFINNAYVRLLVSLIGFELPFIIEENCKLPSDVDTAHLAECLELIKKWASAQPVTFEDGKDSLFFLRTREIDDYEQDYDYADGEGYYDENDDSIAFETSAKLDSERKNLDELDKLDYLEAALEGKSNAYTDNDLPRGVARVKKNSRKLVKKSNDKLKRNKQHLSRRPPKSFKVMSDDEDHKDGTSKSAEFVHGSDDESDDEKENNFFDREERLRRLLEESGGIINPKQLAEFKLAWTRLESNNGSNTALSVSKAIEDTSFVGNNVESSEVEATQSQRIDKDSDMNSIAEPEPDIQSSSKSSTPPIEIDKTSISSFTPESNLSNSKKRNMNLLEDSDNETNGESNIATTIDNGNNKGTTSMRKRRVVISDDED